MKTSQLKLVLFFAISLSLIACSDDDNLNNNEQGNARMSIRMVDNPGDYDEVNVDVEDIVLKYNNQEGEIEVENINDDIYNLLELTGGVSVMLTDDEEVPAGDLSQIRLVLGEDNTIVVDGETYPLQTPSAQQSGLKLNVNTSLEEGITYAYILDFDVEASIVEQGNGGYLLKPVIRIEAVAETGIISGNVLPSTASCLVTASNANTSISTYTNASGAFELNGVPEGTYTVTIEPESGLGLTTQTLNDIEVTNGEITAIGEIDLN